MAASEVVLSKTEINSSQKSESETFENSGVMSRESTNPGKQSEPMGHSEQSDNLKVGFEPTIKQTKDGQGEKQKRKNRALRKFESVDDFEEAEMEEKVIPLSWEQLKVCLCWFNDFQKADKLTIAGLIPNQPGNFRDCLSRVWLSIFAIFLELLLRPLKWGGTLYRGVF